MTQNSPSEYTQVPQGMSPFPAAEDVFAPDQLELAAHLHPLFSLDIATLNPDWSGVLHMLSPLEPYEGFVGQHTEQTGLHGDLLKTNWIGFTLENGRYRLCGDPRYFFLHRDNGALHTQFPELTAELQQHYAEQHQSYAATAEAYRASGTLRRLETYIRDPEPEAFVSQLGGDADGGDNWVQSVPFPKEVISVDGSRRSPSTVYPLSPAGRRFLHVASVPGWHYRTQGADMIVMFYEPVEGLVLFTFDFS
ncbi:hypothetical protein [Pseudomonas sp.]|uniref:hypothetical protein n=1 Tax=Pseudomonas sp. TaxID=306 RepID=UPI0028AC02C1|nr:hypothetical protein [Pseudomonas sp.]